MRKVGRAVLAILAVGFGCAAFIYLTLPDVRALRTSNPETTAFIDLRMREARARGEQPKRVQRWVPYTRISSNLTRAVLVTEDSRFWTHEGIDLGEL
jgi:monofunctional biosynthetic peptidoglycan transglycosylase